MCSTDADDGPEKIRLLLARLGLSHHALKWSSLRKLRHHALLRSLPLALVVIPTVNSALANVGDTITLHFATNPVTVHLGLPFSWRLLFLAALMAAVGTTIFTMRAPRLVKDHSGLGDFLSSGKTVDHVREYDEPEFIGDPVVRRVAEQVAVFGKHDDSDQQRLNSYFWSTWERADGSRPRSARLCHAAYCSAIVLSVIVLVRGIVPTLLSVFKALLTFLWVPRSGGSAADPVLGGRTRKKGLESASAPAS